jgi:hypothetical protein
MRISNFPLSLAAAIGLYAALSSIGARSQGALTPNDYTHCTFDPLAPVCESVYQQALKDTNPYAVSVKNAFEVYGRYMRLPSSGLTDEDRQYLKVNNINIPDDLTAADQGGLHNVINEPALQKDSSARQAAVNGFLSRATQVELYCALNACEATAQTH